MARPLETALLSSTKFLVVEDHWGPTYNIISPRAPFSDLSHWNVGGICILQTQYDNYDYDAPESRWRRQGTLATSQIEEGILIDARAKYVSSIFRKTSEFSDDAWKCWDSELSHEDCLAATSSSTGPQQQNTDDHNCPVDNASSQNTFKYIKMPKTHLTSDNEKMRPCIHLEKPNPWGHA